MNIIVEIICMTKNVIQALFVSIFRFFIPPKKKSVKNDIVLITGSASGIGRQLAIEFCKLGASLVLWDVNERENEETAREIKDLGGKCHTFTCDVSDKEQVFNTGGRVKSEVGDVTILINNAGVVVGKKLLATPDHMIEKTFNVNLLGYFWTVKSFLPSMLRRNHGHIVNIASSAGLVGLNKLTDYSASKFGVVGFTEVLNYEVVYSGYSGVYTTLVCPSFIKTGMFDGCEMRYPAVAPALEVKYTVDRIVQGILTNQQIVCIPRLVYFIQVLKTFLPVSAMMEIHKFFGGDNFMDSFVGRNQKPDSNPNGVDASLDSINGHVSDTEDPLKTL